MADWAPGDLALCIALKVGDFAPSTRLRLGRIYTVVGTHLSRIRGTEQRALELVFAEVKSNSANGGYHHAAFRKVTPEEPDEFDAEVIYDMTYRPSPVFTEIAGMEAGDSPAGFNGPQPGSARQDAFIVGPKHAWAMPAANLNERAA